MNIQSFSLPPIQFDNDGNNKIQFVKIASGINGDVTIKNPNYIDSTKTPIYFGMVNMLTNPNPYQVAYPLNNNDEIVVHLAKGEELYAFCGLHNEGSGVVVMF